jgi:hypothetical protein
MATSSRQSALFGIQDWKRFYQTYRETDFQSYDYETLRKSFIDYLTTYYPETFNDYIESSEYVALLDVIAYMGQALSFRGDLNARENFIDTAERRDSVVKLANLVGYTPKRNIAGQGLLKLTAISTTENILDLNGNNIGNTVVLWNDSANKYWQDQFNLILNASLTNSQRIGRSGNSSVINGIKSYEYTINIDPTELSVLPFSAQVDGTSMNFELVSVSSANSENYYELPPGNNGQFVMLHRNDKLGYGSINTGFFFYFKQGTIQTADFRFLESLENNLQPIDILGVNNDDTWLYELDSDGNSQTQWTKVDNIYGNYSSQSGGTRKVFAVSSRFNDQVNYVFGDGTFGEIPVGSFRAYVRESNARTYTIYPSEMQGIVVNLNYISRTNKVETLTLTLSLQTTCSTALERESITNIKDRAPARYYTQNRMVNGEDYSNFPYTKYNNILKSIALNRSSIGITRNLDLLDPTAKYSSVNVFSDDGALYTDNIDRVITFNNTSVNLALEFISSTLSVSLSSRESIQYYFRYYPRYSPDLSVTGIRWKTLTVSNNKVSGYFYVVNGGIEIPINVGTGSSGNSRYIVPGTHIKFSAPAGKVFDDNNRLINATSTNTKNYIWVGVSEVIGDGYNFGEGALSDGSGPVKLYGYVPSGTLVASTNSIIPAFDNALDSVVVNEVVEYIKQGVSFCLLFDNSVNQSSSRWSVSTKLTSNWFVKFVFNSLNSEYTVNIRNTNYYFGSVNNVRYVFDKNKKIFDYKSGQILSDFVNVFRTNSKPDYSSTLSMDNVLNITDQVMTSDGYPDDYQVKVSSIGLNNISYDPDFYNAIAGENSGYVFFKKITDADSLVRNVLLDSGVVVSNYNTIQEIREHVNEYSTGTVFHYIDGNQQSVFYQSQKNTTVTQTVTDLVNVSEYYSQKSGRSRLNFQYRHNSDNTTRIDMATTNIIDLYLVTQSYYTQYQNWLIDSTDTVVEPSKPTIQELQLSYSELNNFKMISDSVILNSVTFKPLFGKKASNELRGKIKVIKNPSVTVSDSQIRSSVLNALNTYFTLDKWDFGDTFYFSELSSYLHYQLSGLISSVVLVPDNSDQKFGDLYEIRSAPNEIFVNGATATDIVVISNLNSQTLKQ